MTETPAGVIATPSRESPGAATLTSALQPNLPRVVIDRLRIQHVLFALVQNALEAKTRDAEPPRVRIEITGDRYGVQVAVEDRGEGIPDAAREHLFRPFFTTKEHGTGLGLASCRAIAEAHEGSMGFERMAGGGTRFWLRLPAAPQQEGVAHE